VTRTRALALLLVFGCSSKSEAPAPAPTPPPPPPPRPVDAPPLAPGTVLRERSLAQDPDSLVVTPNAIYFSSLSAGVFMLRDGTANKLDGHWATGIVGDDDAFYYVARTNNEDGRLMRMPYVGEPKQLAEWNGRVRGVDDTHVYVQASGDRAAIKLPKAGGDPLTLPCKSGMAVDRDWLYCLERGELARYDKTGQGRAVLGSLPKLWFRDGPVLTDRYVYASTEASNGAFGWNIVRMPRGGGEVEVVSPDAGHIYELTAAGNEAYWAESKHPSSRKMVVRRMGDADPAPSDFADGFGYVRAIVVGATTVFVADSNPARIVELKR